MITGPGQAPEVETENTPAKWTWRAMPRRVIHGSAILLLILAAIGVILNSYWPFRYGKVKPMLEDASSPVTLRFVIITGYIPELLDLLRMA